MKLGSVSGNLNYASNEREGYSRKGKGQWVGGA